MDLNEICRSNKEHMLTNMVQLACEEMVVSIQCV